MGKLYDSLKQRSGGGLPAAVTAGAPPRLQVLPAPAEPVAVDDHEPMPWYEVPSSDSKSITPTIQTPTLFTSTVPTSDVPTPKTRAGKLTFSAAARVGQQSLLGIADEVVVVHQPDSPRAAEYERMAEQLSELLQETRAQSLTLLPLDHSGAASLFSANLGCAWAQKIQQPIVLVDAARSLSDQSLAALLGLGQAPGWEELMTGTPIAQTIQQTGRAWLDVIAAGRRLSLANTQAWAKKAGAVLQSLHKHYRTIVLLSPAYPHSPLGLVLAETTDSTCLLVEADQVDHPQKELLQQALARTSGKVLGTIVMDG